MIAGAAVEEVHVIGRQVDAPEQMLLHERAVASLVVRRQPDELVDVEGVRAGEVRFAGLMQPRELVVDGERRSPRRQAEHGRRLSRELRGDGAGGGMGGLVGGAEHADVHVMFGR